MPYMAQRKGCLEAAVFNKWRLAIPRLGNRIDIALLGLKSMHFVLTPNFWVVVDAVNCDVPIIAWLDFNIADRTDLHKPIPCTLNYYHFAASAIRARALNDAEHYFDEQSTM